MYMESGEQNAITFIAYTGDTCSEDKNGCAEIECFKDVECFDIPAPGLGAVCGVCKTGFTGDGLKCSGNHHQLALDLMLVYIYFQQKILMNVLKMTTYVTKCVRILLEVTHAVVNLAMCSQMKGVKVRKLTA